MDYSVENDHLKLLRCPHCGTASPTMQQAAKFVACGRNWVPFWCTRCGGAIIAETDQHVRAATSVFPSERTVHESVPERAANYLSQAIETLQSPSASIVMSASAVDAMLKDHELKDGTLYNRIAQAVATGIVTKSMGEWAHDVRLDANDERHADDGAEIPTNEDAERALDFVEAIAKMLYVLPAQRARHRKTDE